MKDGVVHDNGHAFAEDGEKHFLQPLIEERGISSAGKEHGRCQFAVDECAYQAGARPAVARAPAIETLADARSAMAALGAGIKPGFIKIDQCVLAIAQHLFRPVFQVMPPSFEMPFGFAVPPRLFLYDSPIRLQA